MLYFVQRNPNTMTQIEAEDLIIRHFPKTIDRKDTIVSDLIELICAADWSEERIQTFCSLLSDMFDDSFTNGVNAGQQTI